MSAFDTTANRTVYCDECKHEFAISAVGIQQSPVIVGRQALELVYFACPKCNKVYRITLRDERCNELQADIESTMRRIRKSHGGKNIKLAGSLDAMVQRKRLRLREYMKHLNGKYTGTFILAVPEDGEGATINYLP